MAVTAYKCKIMKNGEIARYTYVLQLYNSENELVETLYLNKLFWDNIDAIELTSYAENINDNEWLHYEEVYRQHENITIGTNNVNFI